MITKEKIYEYIEQIPPLPDTLKECKDALENKVDLIKAAGIASTDPALMHYLRNIVNKAAFGFKTEVKDAHQIFGILGLERSLQIINSYLFSLITPKRWSVFEMDDQKFFSLQSELIELWNKILSYEKCSDKHIAQTVTVIASSIIVCEELFKDNLEDFLLLKETKNISYNKILKKLTGFSLFDISIMICEKWELPKKDVLILKILENKDAKCDKQYLRFAKFLHLLLFYLFSKAEFLESGLNDFLDFDTEFVAEIYEDFMSILGDK
jgi:HD-like signal output (HDOD) protein